MSANTRFTPGSVADIRAFTEIAATLDGNGCLESLPFMPEMKALCGTRVRVFRRLEKTCVEGSGARSLASTVILESLHCDGSAHDGCQKRCPLLWKEAWLRPVTDPARDPARAPREPSEQQAFLKTRNDDHRYFCQSTELANATTVLPGTSLRKYVGEFTAGNVTAVQALRLLGRSGFLRLRGKLLGPSPIRPTGAPAGAPPEPLDLQPGEIVEVKKPEEIAPTLDRRGRNRGLVFTPQMKPFCGGRYAVKNRVDRMILETTGRMREFKSTVILEDVTCDGTVILGGCSRNAYHLWREVWLRRVSPPSDGSSSTAG